MKTVLGHLTLGLAACLLLAGCKTTPPVDWNARIGNYTYDQAVNDLGPPDKTAKLDNGQTVADWITSQRQGGSVSIGTGFWGGGHQSGMGVGVGQTVGGSQRDRILRLTFGPDNQLLSWWKN